VRFFASARCPRLGPGMRERFVRDESGGLITGDPSPGRSSKMQAVAGSGKMKVEYGAADRQGASRGAPGRDSFPDTVAELRGPEDAVPLSAFLLELGLDSMAPKPSDEIIGRGVFGRIGGWLGDASSSVDQPGDLAIERTTRLRGTVTEHVGTGRILRPRFRDGCAPCEFRLGPIVSR
jgi:hypothetical protein